jgi:hypothetical protein
LIEPESLGNLKAAFESNLTEVGQDQFKILENYIKNSHKCFSSDEFYAPILPLIQSSGFGKSKICDELLLIHPGIAAVFRGSKSEENLYSYPLESFWIENMMNFIYLNTMDEVPEENTIFFLLQMFLNIRLDACYW